MADTEQKTTNEQVVCRLIEDVWSKGNYDIVDELVTEDYVEHDPALSEDVTGREEFTENVDGFRETLVGLEKDIETVVAEGDTVAVEYTFTGTHEATLWDTEPTGTEVSAKGIFVFHLTDGKVDEVTHLWDAYNTLRQMDAIPTDTDW